MGCQQTESSRRTEKKNPQPIQDVGKKGEVILVSEGMPKNNLNNNFKSKSVIKVTNKIELNQNNDKINVSVPLSNGIKFQKEYNKDEVIQNVVDDIQKQNNLEIPPNYSINLIKDDNNIIQPNEQINTLLKEGQNIINIRGEMVRDPLVLSDEIDIPEIVGRPFDNPFQIYTYETKNNSFKVQKYDSNKVEELGLNNFNYSSAYCNGNNKLFISGGVDKSGNPINKFWAIDLRNEEIIAIDMPHKQNHSMIFIPTKYVFIVGGNDKKTYLYDIEKQKIEEWADLMWDREEPALINIGNYLYCFNNYNKDKCPVFIYEKTDLSSGKPNWNIKNTSMSPAIEELGGIKQKFFGATTDLDGNIIFLGGNYDGENLKDDAKCTKLNIQTDTIELSNVTYKKIDLKEKTFLPFNQKNTINYILSDFNSHHPEVVFFSKNREEIKASTFLPNKSSLKNDEINLNFNPIYQKSSRFNFNMPKSKSENEYGKYEIN